ncbi:MAG: response regulator transcription factor [Elusimicrobia bacterium]|nr:response regulator transcription factor [Elusimicrobiota bacterium]
MDNLLFHIISPAPVISGRWRSAFAKEGWTALVSPGAGESPAHSGGRVELALVEICVPSFRSQEDLKSLLKARRPVSLLIFGEQARVSNTQIAAFLEAGADDFVFKNLDERVLVAKLKAHVRRLLPAIQEAAARLSSSCGEVQIDKSKRAVRVAVKRGKFRELENLTQKEFEILSLLVNNEAKVLSREAILEKLWGDSAGEVYSECIDKHIESLRRKLGLYGRKIRTVYGSGYMFVGSKGA